MNAKLAAAMATAMLLLGAVAARAQVNVEPFRKKLRDEGTSGSLEGSLVGRLGNNEGLIAGAAGQVGFASRRHLSFAHASGDYTQMNKSVLVARAFAHVRYNLTLIDEVLWGEVFAQTQMDEFLLLRRRELYGLGPRVALVQDDRMQLIAGVSCMYEHERVGVPEGASDRRVTNLLRASSYLAVTLTSDPRVTFSVMSFFQPAFADPSDYRVYVESLLAIAMGKSFSVRLYAQLRFDSEPVSTIRGTDLELRNAFAWAL